MKEKCNFNSVTDIQKCSSNLSLFIRCQPDLRIFNYELPVGGGGAGRTRWRQFIATRQLGDTKAFVVRELNRLGDNSICTYGLEHEVHGVIFLFKGGGDTMVSSHRISPTLVRPRWTTIRTWFLTMVFTTKRPSINAMGVVILTL